MENIDIDIDKDNLKNIDIDIDIDMAILENIDIDIDKGISQNIDIDKILYRLEFGISNTPNAGIYFYLAVNFASVLFCFICRQHKKL